MSLNNNKVENVGMSSGIVDVIKGIGKTLSNHFRKRKPFGFAFQSKNKIYDRLNRNDIHATYSRDRGEFLLLAEVRNDGKVYYEDMVTGQRLTEQEYIDKTENTTEIDITAFISKDDILYANLYPAIDTGSLKTKIESSLKENPAMLKKAYI